MKKIVIFGGFFCFKLLPLNDKQKFEFPYYLIDRERLLLSILAVVCLSDEKPLDFYITTLSVSHFYFLL